MSEPEIKTEKKAVASSESDSDDDIPLSKLGGSGIDNEAPEISMAIPQSNGSKRPNPDDDDDDDDDEIPIMQMKDKVKAKKIKKENSPVIKKEHSPVVKKEKKPVPRKIRKSSSDAEDSQPLAPKKKKSGSRKIKFKQQEASEALYSTEKGEMVQQLLCRWWYAVEWPKGQQNYESEPGMEALDGFPGAVIVVKGEDMGKVIDKRPAQDKPCFMTFFAKPAVEIQSLLVTAYVEQMKVLQEHEGPNAPLLKTLKKSLAEVQKIKCDKADKEALKEMKKWKDFSDQIAIIQSK